MIRISNIRFEIYRSEDSLRDYVTDKYGLAGITSFELSKKSLDARRKNDIHYVYSVDVCCENEKYFVKKYPNIDFAEKFEYVFPDGGNKDETIVIAGFGPAGMMCALTLVENGYGVIVLERGKKVEERAEDIKKFRECRVLDPNSNVQFGEGGAGTFSDGKLTTGIKDRRIKKVIDEFYAHGAPKEILYNSKPHLGTDNLQNIVKNIREDIISKGGEIRFNSTLTDIEIKNGAVVSVTVNSEKKIKTNKLILAVGHSARDTFEMLKGHQIPMAKKPFSVGVRIEHRQEEINRAQYADAAKYLSAADYKLNVKTKSGRGVYTFCMCPGGEVIASASEKGGVVTNGMSCFARDGKNSNSALLVGVTPEDFGSDDVLAGMYFQREIERRTFNASGGNYSALCETVGHLYGGENKSSIKPSYMPGVVYGSIAEVFPDFIVDSIKEALPMLDKKLNGFANAEAVMTAPETRSSSPVRILRDSDTMQSEIKGLFPCGEGAGYAGGITSAAVDGIRAAEAAVKK